MKKQHSKLATRRAMAIGGGIGLLLVLGMAVSSISLGGDDTSAQPLTASESPSQHSIKDWACQYYGEHRDDAVSVPVATTLYAGTEGKPGAMFATGPLKNSAHDLLEGAEARRDGNRYDVAPAMKTLDGICGIS